MRADADVKAPEVLVDVRHGGISGHGAKSEAPLLAPPLQSPLSTITPRLLHVQSLILVSIGTPHHCPGTPHRPYDWHVKT
jgi:hypothetical protein